MKQPRQPDHAAATTGGNDQYQQQNQQQNQQPTVIAPASGLEPTHTFRIVQSSTISAKVTAVCAALAGIDSSDPGSPDPKDALATGGGGPLTNAAEASTADGGKKMKQQQPQNEKQRPPFPPSRPLVALVAIGKAAGKAVSVAEIVKREMDRLGQGWFQYSSIGSVMVERQRKKGSGGGGKKGGGAEDVEMTDEEVENEDEAAFEPLQEPLKTMRVPVLTIYLSRVSVLELKKLYGEQSAQ